MTPKETASFVWVTKLTVSHGTPREVFYYNLPTLKRQRNNYYKLIFGCNCEKSYLLVVAVPKF